VDAQDNRNERLADALVALGEAFEAIPQFERELPAAAAVLRSEETIRRFLADPTVNDQGKCLTLERILGANIHPALMHFLAMLQRQNLLARLDDVATAFSERVSLLGRKVAGELMTARPLSDTRVTEIEAEVGRALGKDVHLAVRINEDLMGGVLVRVGSVVMDGTADRRLEAIGKALTSQARK
jgi:F-type H+-transporting ATPase subunit delta